MSKDPMSSDLNPLFFLACEKMKTINGEEEKRKIWVTHLLSAGGSWYNPVTDCDVCYEPRHLRRNWTCQHKLCHWCIRKIKEINDRCPMCRNTKH